MSAYYCIYKSGAINVLKKIYLYISPNIIITSLIFHLFTEYILIEAFLSPIKRLFDGRIESEVSSPATFLVYSIMD